MTFSKINPAGWSLYDDLLPDQINDLQDDMVNAIDGGGGGTYAPLAPIKIAGYLYSTTFKNSFNCINPNTNIANWQYYYNSGKCAWVPSSNTSGQLIVFPIKVEALQQVKAVINWNSNLTSVATTPTKHTTLATWSLEKVSSSGTITVLESGSFDNGTYNGSYTVVSNNFYDINPTSESCQITVASPTGGSGAPGIPPTYSVFGIVSVGVTGN